MTVLFPVPTDEMFQGADLVTEIMSGEIGITQKACTSVKNYSEFLPRKTNR